ncbi:uncharacterized protein LOC142238661 [Haematobia irritans]|uniref:uncharacterized protein LOC142222519 n=2 Tax=Haematobia irritans TaxID=7368 RepID=UPI003F5044E8
MISFDVVSLFPSIPVNLAIKIIKEKWDEIKDYTKIPMDIFIEMLTFCIKDSRYFVYDDKVYEQRKGMPMGSPASPIIADIVMEVLLDSVLEKLTIKPKIMTKYVDDLFCILNKNDVQATLSALNAFDRQIQFTMETEEDNKLPYLDTIILRHRNGIKINWYQKPTATGRLINFNSKHPRRVIMNTATNFIRRVHDISDKIFHKDNEDKIRTILRLNDFPNKTIDDLIQHVKEQQHIKHDEIEPKIYKPLTYVPQFSERFKSSNMLNKDKFQIAQRTHNTVNQFFSKTKSKIKKEDKSNVVYKIKCNGNDSDTCQKVYIGTTKTKLKTRLSGHKSDQKATDKPLEQKTALAAHCTLTGHKPNFKDVDILTQETNYKRRFTLEMLHIINVPAERRMNFKTDTDHCAHIYRNIVQKYRKTD